MKYTGTILTVSIVSIVSIVIIGCFPDRHVTEPEYAPDFTRPSVSQMVPLNNANNVPLGVDLTIWFSKLMKTESISHNSVLSISVELDSVRAIAFDPQNPGVVYAGKKNGGIFKSMDNGNNWEWISLNYLQISIIDLEISVSNSNVIYALTETMLYRSQDAGVTWSILESVANLGSLTSMTISAEDENVLYVATNGNGIFKSTNGGIDWVAKNQGLRLGRRFNDIMLSKNNDDVLFIASEGDYIYRSTDGGESWIRVREGLTSRDINVVHTSNTEPGLVFAGSLDGGLFMSTSNGDGWIPISNEVAYQTIYSIATSAENADMILMATNGGIYKTDTRGEEWIAVDAKLTNGSTLSEIPTYSVDIDPHSTGTMLAGNDYGLFRGELASPEILQSSDIIQDNLIVEGNYIYETWRDTTIVIALSDYNDEASAVATIIHPYIVQRALSGWIAGGKVGNPPIDPNPDATKVIFTPAGELLPDFTYKFEIFGSFFEDDTYKGTPGVEDIHGNSMEYDYIRLFNTRK